MQYAHTHASHTGRIDRHVTFNAQILAPVLPPASSTDSSSPRAVAAAASMPKMRPIVFRVGRMIQVSQSTRARTSSDSRCHIAQSTATVKDERWYFVLRTSFVRWSYRRHKHSPQHVRSLLNDPSTGLRHYAIECPIIVTTSNRRPFRRLAYFHLSVNSTLLSLHVTEIPHFRSSSGLTGGEPPVDLCKLRLVSNLVEILSYLIIRKTFKILLLRDNNFNRLSAGFTSDPLETHSAPQIEWLDWGTPWSGVERKGRGRGKRQCRGGRVVGILKGRGELKEGHKVGKEGDGSRRNRSAVYTPL